MNQKDLRLGNLVNDHLGRTLQVVGLKDDNVYLVLSNGEKIRYNIKTIQPILITEEQLKSFGFNGWDIDNYTITLTNGNFFVLECNHPIATDIFHVHQLQNLYFALTSKELIIK